MKKLTIISIGVIASAILSIGVIVGAMSLVLNNNFLSTEHKQCDLSDGSFFEFIGRRATLSSPHYIGSCGKVRDCFAYAYSIIFHSKDGYTSTLPFNDNAPKCENYGIAESSIFALTDKAIYAFHTPGGKWGGSALFVSQDRGRTFSRNLHPNSQESETGEPTPLQIIFSEYGYYRSRFQIRNDEYQLEITDPLSYEEFLLFSSKDNGKTWKGPKYHKEPRVFNREEVQK